MFTLRFYEIPSCDFNAWMLKIDEYLPCSCFYRNSVYSECSAATVFCCLTTVLFNIRRSLLFNFRLIMFCVRCHHRGYCRSWTLNSTAVIATDFSADRAPMVHFSLLRTRRSHITAIAYLKRRRTRRAIGNMMVLYCVLFTLFCLSPIEGRRLDYCSN